MNYRFVIRELFHSRGQGILFALCVALSCLTVISVASLGRDIERSVALDGRSLHGGDLIVHSHSPFPRGLVREIEHQMRDAGDSFARSWEFTSMLQDPAGNRSLLTVVKGVSDGYPLYGAIALNSGRPFREVLQPGGIVVARAVLDRLGVKVGDRVRLGRTGLRIADSIEYESGRPVEFFNFGPRVFVHRDDLDRLGLLLQGSRVHHEILLRIADQTRLETIRDALGRVARESEVRISSFADNHSPIKRLYTNLLFFLGLVSIFVMLLAGVSMSSSLDALFRTRRTGIGAMRALGASSGYIFKHYILVVLLLALLGLAIGLVAGYGARNLSGRLFQDLLPAGVEPGLSWTVLAEGIGFSLLVSMLFTALPLLRLGEIRALSLLGRGDGASRASFFQRFALSGIATLLLGSLLVVRLGELESGLWLLGGMGALFTLVAMVARLFLYVVQRLPMVSLSFRQALRSLLRPGNATSSIVLTLSTAIGLLFAIALLAANLRATYINSYPADAPNLFAIDIQPNQKDAFLELVGDTLLYPVVRGRLKQINGENIGVEKDGPRFRDSLTREFNLSYRDQLLADERLIKGKSLFDSTSRPGIVPVSLLDRVAELGDLEIGDRLRFTIQGVAIEAEVSSIRSRTRSMLHPFFYFIFPTKVLERAPKTFFAALHAETATVNELENRIVSRFPNLTTINVIETAARLEKVADRMITLVSFFASFALLAGSLVFISSILATRLERTREVVYLSVLGASRWWILRVFVYEQFLLTLVSGGCGVVLAEGLVWGVCRYLLETDFSPFPGMGCAVVTATFGVLLLLGIMVSYGILRVRPLAILKGMV